MAHIGSRADFEEMVLTRPWQCYECHKRFLPGARILVSKKKGRSRKQVCSEECRQAFEERFWEGKALARAAARGKYEEEEADREIFGGGVIE